MACIAKGLEVVDQIEQTFATCKHPFVDPNNPHGGWCNLCGSVKLGNGEWLRPHWRDLLLAALLALQGDHDPQA